MGLTKCRLGEYIERRVETNAELTYGAEYVRGVNNLKMLIPTKADISGRDLSKFQIVSPGEFVFNHRTSRNGSKFSIAYNDGDAPVICTEDYVVFRIKEQSKNTLLNEWLYMYFNRPEFDRYVITNSWGSSTEFYNWEDVCDIEIELPVLSVQQKFVAIYKAMVANQQSYEQGLCDLKLSCDGYIENLRRNHPCQKIGKYLVYVDQRNDIGLGIDSVRGLSTGKEMIPTKADMDGEWTEQYMKFIKDGKEIMRGYVEGNVMQSICLLEGSSFIKTSDGFYVGYSARELFQKKKMNWETYFMGETFASSGHYMYYVKSDYLENTDIPAKASDFKSSATVSRIDYNK